MSAALALSSPSLPKSADLPIMLNFENFNSQLSSAKVSVSLWGTRQVEIQGTYYSLDYLAKGAAALLASYPVDKGLSKPAMSHEECVAGLSVTRQIKQLYVKTDEMLKTANIFTRFFNYIREFSFIPYTTRFYVDENIWGGVNPFNEGTTNLRSIQQKMDSEEYTPEMAKTELNNQYGSILHHAIWEVSGKPEFGYDRPYGQEILDQEPKGELVKAAVARILEFPTVAAYARTYLEENSRLIKTEFV